MSRAKPAILLVAALVFGGGLASFASDWEEDDVPAARSGVPRPAPDFRRNRAYEQRLPDEVMEDPDKAGDGKRTAFFANPGANEPRHGGHPGGGKRLEGGVSKYGQGSTGPVLRGDAQATGLRGGVDNLFFQQLQPMAPVRAQSTPPIVFRNWLEKNHNQFALGTSPMSRDLVLEVRGQWDESGRTIRSLGVPYTSIRPGKLDDYPLDATKILVINCAGKVPQPALQRIRDFVARGGFLLTTDWALDGVVRRAFPGYVEWNNGQTDGGVVDGIVVDNDPVLTRGAVRRAGWKLDEGSQTLRVLNPRAVHVLVRSQKLMRSGLDPDGQGILAVWFPFGRGQVMHLVGHFDNNAGLAFTSMLPDPAPGMGISLRQGLATNFLVSALEGKDQQAVP